MIYLSTKLKTKVEKSIINYFSLPSFDLIPIVIMGYEVFEKPAQEVKDDSTLQQILDAGLSRDKYARTLKCFGATVDNNSKIVCKPARRSFSGLRNIVDTYNPKITEKEFFSGLIKLCETTPYFISWCPDISKHVVCWYDTPKTDKAIGFMHINTLLGHDKNTKDPYTLREAMSIAERNREEFY